MDAGYQFLFLGLFILFFIIPAIFFLITQQETLKRIQPQNRLMRPGQVWLQMIPLFGLVYQFFVVSRISESIRQELNTHTFSFESGNEENLFQNDFRPTYNIGIAYCILMCLSVLPIPLIKSLFTLAGIVCWIIYWVQLSGYKKKLEQKSYAFASPPTFP